MLALVRVRRSEEMNQLNASYAQESEPPVESHRGCLQLKFLRFYRFLEKGRTEKEKKSVLIFVQEERIRVT